MTKEEVNKRYLEIAKTIERMNLEKQEIVLDFVSALIGDLDESQGQISHYKSRINDLVLSLDKHKLRMDYLTHKTVLLEYLLSGALYRLLTHKSEFHLDTPEEYTDMVWQRLEEFAKSEVSRHNP